MHSHTQDNVLHDVNTLSNRELEDLYGISIEEDGTVVDTVTGKTYNTILLWAAEQEQEEEWDEASHPHQTSHRFDDI